MKLHTSYLFIFLAWPFVGLAQLHEEGAYKVDYDTNYIVDYRHRLSVALTSEYRVTDFVTVRPNEGHLLYTSNLPRPTFGIMFTYRWLNFTYSIPLTGLSTFNKDYSETSSTRLALGITGRKMYVRTFYEDLKGFRLSNPRDIDPFYFAGRQYQYRGFTAFAGLALSNVVCFCHPYTSTYWCIFEYAKFRFEYQ